MRKCQNPRTSRSRSRQTVEKRQNFHISIETFWSGHWCLDEISRLSRHIFWKCRDFLDCRDSQLRHDRDKLRPPGLDLSLVYCFSFLTRSFISHKNWERDKISLMVRIYQSQSTLYIMYLHRLLIVIIQLMLSASLCPKVITLNGFCCINCSNLKSNHLSIVFPLDKCR
jgi:hypothetical protein